MNGFPETGSSTAVAGHHRFRDPRTDASGPRRVVDLSVHWVPGTAG